ncbi:hypothetical protein BDN70DRAFT_841996 [Pholiota conissans]|uniref:BTB domain-containing protein n=1 Tax=Pholiota conissans TaxID=109636 RepID=A0A9P6CVW2_9AGAR|nr:hypothetical protein BDN70DRAFT_841996 [Pholiota conissans]
MESSDSELEESEKDSSETSPSSLFNNSEADVTFISADKIVFKIHSKYFEATSGGFAVPEYTLVEEPVDLAESGEVLEILFQYIHPPSELGKFLQPSVMDLDTDLFFEVAKAAEKYIVYSVMNMCIMRMQFTLYESHPIAVLNHAANHNYEELADLAAPNTIPCSLEEILEGLTNPCVAVQWFKYYSRWVQLQKTVVELMRQAELSYPECRQHTTRLTMFLRNIIHDPSNVDFDLATPGLGCGYRGGCECESGKWKTRIENEVEAIPNFSEIT